MQPHPQRSYVGALLGLCFLACASPGFAVAHGSGGGNGGGHGMSSHGSGRGHTHHRRGWGWRGERGYGGAGYRGGNLGAWSVPGHGLYFASIPSYCKLVYWEGVGYYYADDIYYEWSGTVGGFQEVQPPAGLAEQIEAEAPAVAELFVFPNGNQSDQQLAQDRAACHRWAVQEIGADPGTKPTENDNPEHPDHSATMRDRYRRADAACLEARDYSVE